MTIYRGTNHIMLRELQDILHSINPFVQQFKSAGEAAAGGNELELIIRADTGDVDRRRYNLPTAAHKVAALLPGEPISRDIVIQHRSNRLQRIVEINAACDPLLSSLCSCTVTKAGICRFRHYKTLLPTPIW